ncbi:MAG: hypothetical protein ACOYYI_13035 [Chloroflexota bacterium]
MFGVSVSNLRRRFVFLSLLISFILFGCRPQKTPSPIAEPTFTASPTLQAEQILHEYCSALQARDYEKAASLFSTKVGITRSELIRLWKDNDAKGWRMVSCEVTNKKIFDENRVVFWVNIKQEGLEPAEYSTVNVLHFERGMWLVGNATLDKFGLNVRPKTQSQLAVFPSVMLRLVSGIEIWVNLTNDNDQAVLWGAEGKTCGKLFWEDFALDAPCPSPVLRIEPGQTHNIPLIFSLDAFTRLDLPTQLEVLLFRLETNTTASWNYRFDLVTESP